MLYRLGLAGGISTTIDKAHHRSRVNEWSTECAPHIFPKQELKFMPPEKEGEKEGKKKGKRREKEGKKKGKRKKKRKKEKKR